MTTSKRALLRASLAVMAGIIATPGWAADDPAPADSADDILITAQRQKQTIENTPNTRAGVDAEILHTVEQTVRDVLADQA